MGWHDGCSANQAEIFHRDEGMKILMVVANFVPEIGSAAHLYFDLAKGFLKRGHEVDVITSYPREFYLTYPDTGREFPCDEVIEGVEVHRCRHIGMRDNLFVRGLEHFYLPYYYFRTYRHLGKQFDVCLMYIPPLPLFYLARMIRRFDSTPSVLNFQDFHPQELTDVGVMQNRLLIKLMEKLESSSYQCAEHITVLSEGGIRYVVDRGADPEKVSHIFNAAPLSEIDPCLVRKDFKEAQNLQDTVLITYAGILSPFQGLESILRVAKSMQNCERIQFCIAGDGMSRRSLEEMIQREKIGNVQLLPLLPREGYLNLINSSDISIVSLDDRMKAPCIPGKVLNLMAASQPILAVVPDNCETARLINHAGCGIIVKPSDTDAFRSALIRLARDPELRRDYGVCGRQFLEEHMNLTCAVSKYEEIFGSLLRSEIRSAEMPGPGREVGYGWR